MFLNPDFAPVRPDYLSERFLLISSHLGLPRIRFHDLRHTHATIALATGVPINVVSERLGHTNTSATLNVYSRVMPGMGARAAHDIANQVIGFDPIDQEGEAAAKLTREPTRPMAPPTRTAPANHRSGAALRGRNPPSGWQRQYGADESPTATRFHVPCYSGEAVGEVLRIWAVDP